MTVTEIIAIGTEIITLCGVVVPVYRMIKKMMGTIKLITDGTRCQLRSDMLKTYYANKPTKTIREYELENFIKIYNAYKALGGNSFIDKVYEEVMEWDVVK